MTYLPECEGLRSLRHSTEYPEWERLSFSPWMRTYLSALGWAGAVFARHDPRTEHMSTQKTAATEAGRMSVDCAWSGDVRGAAARNWARIRQCVLRQLPSWMVLGR